MSNSSSFFGVKRLTYKGLTYGSLRNYSYTRMDSIWSCGSLGFNLINFVDRKNFLANILKQESGTWRAESINFAFRILMEAWHYDV